MKHQIWAENSPVISFPGPTNFVFYIAVTWGICVLCHSFYINRFKVSIVRCTTDIAALGLVLEAVCFLSCIWKTNCTLLSTEIAYSAIANSFFGALIQACDNYMTFIRYSIVCGGASKMHHYLALAYVVIFLYGSWWEFFFLMPFFENMNSSKWLFVINVVTADINLSSYIAYDVFYIVMLTKLIYDNKRHSTVASASGDRKLEVLAAKAGCHTLFSLLGIVFYTKAGSIGIIAQNVCIVSGLHIFLNWKDSQNFPRRLLQFLTCGVIGKTSTSSRPFSSTAGASVKPSSIASLAAVSTIKVHPSPYLSREGVSTHSDQALESSEAGANITAMGPWIEGYSSDLKPGDTSPDQLDGERNGQSNAAESTIVTFSAIENLPTTHGNADMSS